MTHNAEGYPNETHSTVYITNSLPREHGCIDRTVAVDPDNAHGKNRQPLSPLHVTLKTRLR